MTLICQSCVHSRRWGLLGEPEAPESKGLRVPLGRDPGPAPKAWPGGDPPYLSPGFLWGSFNPCLTQSSLSTEDPKAQMYMSSSSSGLVSEHPPSLPFLLPFGAGWEGSLPVLSLPALFPLSQLSDPPDCLFPIFPHKHVVSSKEDTGGLEHAVSMLLLFCC